MQHKFKLIIVKLNLIFFNTIIITPHLLVINPINHMMRTNSNINEFMYSGEILGYFLLKSSNINKNETIKSIRNNIIKNKTKIFPNQSISSIREETSNIFNISLISSVINLSIYGMTNWREFFGEAYAKWTMTPNEMKNKSWEILNNFFIDIYPKLHHSYFGKRSNNLQVILNFIDDYFQDNSRVFYDTTLLTIPNDRVDLKYKDLFGLQQIIHKDDNDITMSWNYTFNALKTAMIRWHHNDNNDVDNDSMHFSHNIIYQYIIKDSKLSNNLAMIMNDSYTKSSATAINKYNTLLNTLQNKYYSSFLKLDERLKKHTKLEQKNSTIMLKGVLNEIVHHYNWSNEKEIEFKQQMLILFNLTNFVTDEKFKYFLTGFMFTPDYPMQNYPKGTMGVTLTEGTGLFQQWFSVTSARVIITGRAFNLNNYLIENINDQYLLQWSSSPNIFAVIIHEMGHVIDSYYGTTIQHRINLPFHFKSYLQNKKLNDWYSGKLFGYCNSEGDNNKDNDYNLKLIFLIIFGIFGITILIIIIIKYSKKKH